MDEAREPEPEREVKAEVEIRVFTHPACSGCSTAVRQAWSLGEAHPEVVVIRTISLEEKEGLAEARAESVRTIPTVILATRSGESQRWAGTPEPGLLEGAVEEALAQLTSST